MELEYQIVGQAGYKVLQPLDYFKSSDEAEETYGCEIIGEPNNNYIDLKIEADYSIYKIGIQAKPKTKFSLWLNEESTEGEPSASFIIGASGIFELDAGIAIAPKIRIYNYKTLTEPTFFDNLSIYTDVLKEKTEILQNNLKTILSLNSQGNVVIDQDYNGTTENATITDMWDSVYETVAQFQDVYSEHYLNYKRARYGQYIIGSIAPSNIIIDYVAGTVKEE